MQYVGFLLIGIAVIALIVGLLQQLKMKKILAAPFKKTGEIAQNPAVADAQGRVSTEGAVQVTQPFVSPVSGKPCIYYEVKIERMWEKWTNTEDGQKKTTGTSTVSETKNGTQFYLNDGSGPVGVDAREKVDGELVQAFQQSQNVSSGDIYFGPGNFHAHVPYSGGEERTTGVKCTEKIIDAQGNLFVMGKLAGGVITKEDGMTGKLLVSSKGRDKLVGHTKRNMIIGYVAGVLMLGGGIPVSILGDAPKDTCADMKDGLKDVCSDRVTDDTGQTKEWKVSKAGGYTVSVKGTGKDKAMRLWPHVTVNKGADEVADESSDGVTSISQCFAKGDYKIKIRDVSKGHVGGTIKGGAGYTLDIKENKKLTCKDGEGDKADKKKSADDDDKADKKKADDDDKADKKKAADDDDKADKKKADD
jgi:hypothetical protein